MSTAVRQLRLPPMPKISDLIRLYGLRARKQLSQNFILDLNVTDKIARKADVFDCHVVEVGSGPGSLTRSLLNAGVRHLHAVEIDDRFMPSLELLQDASEDHMTIHHEDIMTFDMNPLCEHVIEAPWESEQLPNLRLVGNLPFAVSIPLFLQWLHALSVKAGPFSCGRVPMTLVFQKEVGVNMLAETFDPGRSRLAVMAQNYCHVTKEMELKSSVFVPEPKIDAWLMHLVPRKRSIIEAPFDILEQVVKAVFSMKRKMIRRPLTRLFPGNEKLAGVLLRRIRMNPETRIHRLSLEDFGAITGEFIAMCDEMNLTKYPMVVNKPNKMIGVD